MKNAHISIANSFKLLICCCLAACQSIDRYEFDKCASKKREPLKCVPQERVAEDFWEYAVMAADTYRAMDKITWKDLLLRSDKKPRNELALQDNQETHVEDDSWQEDASIRFGNRNFCPTEAKALSIDDCNARDACRENNASIQKQATPKKNFISVPIRIEPWVRLIDFDRHAPAKGFRVFVPGLYVEVWAKDIQASEKNAMPHSEYALVFRGTQDGGGWFSNLRFITALVPFFHDQYKQAALIFPRIMTQISLREYELEPDKESRKRDKPTITVVGHSLGAGLAIYTALKNNGVNKIVGFNPSPITGASFIPDDVVVKNLDSVKSVDFVFENAEILHYFGGCSDNKPLDPRFPRLTIGCHQINLIGGDTFDQHEMGPMACRMTAIKNMVRKLPKPVISASK